MGIALSRHLTRLIKAVRQLGVRDGLQAFYYYVYYRLVRSRRWTPVLMTLRRFQTPVWFRPGVSDWIALERIFLDQEYDPLSLTHDAAVDEVLEDIKSSGRRPLIIDCGANVGFASVWLSRRFPGATIVAVEPEPENFRILELNANHYPNLKPINAAISHKEARVELVNGGAPWAWQTRHSISGCVRTTTITEICKSYGESVLFCVKMDIEGFEVQALQDDAKWIDDLPLLVFEMHDWMMPWAGSGHAFLSALTRTRRDYLVRGENIFSYSHSALRVDGAPPESRSQTAGSVAG